MCVFVCDFALGKQSFVQLLTWGLLLEEPSRSSSKQHFLSPLPPLEHMLPPSSLPLKPTLTVDTLWGGPPLTTGKAATVPQRLVALVWA